jgi:hypothetical protein
MPIYMALWRTQELEEEAHGDRASLHLVRWLRRAQTRNDLWCVETRRVSREHPWSIFVWWRPRDAQGVMQPAPATAPTGVCDEYYRCGPRGVDGGFVRWISPRQAAVRTGHCLMLVPRET